MFPCTGSKDRRAAPLDDEWSRKDMQEVLASLWPAMAMGDFF